MIAVINTTLKGNKKELTAEVVGSLADKAKLKARVLNYFKIPLNKRHLYKLQSTKVIRVIEQ